jgi:hypothetical protein
MNRVQRSQRGRRALLAVLCVALVFGLLLCGPAHSALHALVAGDGHGDFDGSYCAGCNLSGLESPAPVYVFGPELRALVFIEHLPAHVPPAPPLLAHSPRGPPSFLV